MKNIFGWIQFGRARELPTWNYQLEGRVEYDPTAKSLFLADDTGWVDLGGGGGSYTDEEAQDAVAGIMLDTTSTAWTYVDATPTLAVNVKDEYVEDTVATMVGASTNIAASYSDGTDSLTLDLTTAAKTFTINFVIDGGGSVITTGIKGDLVVDPDCHIMSWTLLADVSGAIVIDIWQDTYANYPPVDADSITGAETPTITASGTQAQDNTLAGAVGWDIGGGRILRFNVDSVTAITRVTLALTCVRD